MLPVSTKAITYQHWNRTGIGDMDTVQFVFTYNLVDLIGVVVLLMLAALAVHLWIKAK